MAATPPNDHGSHDTDHKDHTAHTDSGAPNAHDDHGEHTDPVDPDESTIQSPWWLPLVGLSLLVAVAMGVYLFITPGVLSPSATSRDGGLARPDIALEQSPHGERSPQVLA